MRRRRAGGRFAASPSIEATRFVTAGVSALFNNQLNTSNVAWDTLCWDEVNAMCRFRKDLVDHRRNTRTLQQSVRHMDGVAQHHGLRDMY